AGSALEARKFEKSTVRTFPVWSFGEDGANNLARRDIHDPFGRGLGRAQRIALLGDRVVISAQTDVLDPALVALNRPRLCAMCPTYSAILGEAKRNAGGKAEVLAATGLGVQIPLTDAELSAKIAGVKSDDEAGRVIAEFIQKRASRVTMPGYRVAVLLATRIGTGGVAQIGLAYANEEDARKGVPIIAKRLAAETIGALGVFSASIGKERPPQKATETRIVEKDGEWIGIITIRYEGDWTIAFKEFKSWKNLVLSRSFSVLSILD
ncbi:MAG TPA: hypothetical protein PK264_22610, partial [Hyphomicrobiaceae bacterium]|nr:hypothetical protein [Hyphomicrobiaceae bacterium]